MGRRALKALVGLQIVLRVALLAELLVRMLGRLPGKRLPTIIVGHQLIQGVRQPIDRRRGGQASRLPIEHHLGNAADRSEEHTSELQSLMRNAYAVFCLKKKK